MSEENWNEEHDLLLDILNYVSDRRLWDKVEKKYKDVWSVMLAHYPKNSRIIGGAPWLKPGWGPATVAGGGPKVSHGVRHGANLGTKTGSVATGAKLGDMDVLNSIYDSFDFEFEDDPTNPGLGHSSRANTTEHDDMLDFFFPKE